MSHSSAVTSLLRRLPAALIVGMLIWLGCRPILDPAITGLAEILIRGFEYPRVTQIIAADHHAEVRRSDFRSDSKIPTIPLTENNFNTIVLLALFLALPRPFSKSQLEKLLMGWCVLYFTQTLNLVFHVKCLYALGLGEWSQQQYSDFARNFYGYLRYFTDLPGRFSFPFLIWMGFNWEQILGLIQLQPLPASDGAEPRSSGKKKKK
ncbi:MAG: hypothetical protein K8R59_09935 [Thermoanaerobaculales bacterium]|nr:hypothetical protein [Thermoanaerobaculales bacterium]